MSAPTETPAELLEVSGSCHCGAIKYTAKNVNFAKAGKCNCTICVATGRLGLSLPPGSITVTNTPTGNPTALRHDNATNATLFPAELAYYSPDAHRNQLPRDAERIRHFFCRVCSVSLFIIGEIPGMGEYSSINILTLDLKSVDKDLKDLSDPKKLTYCCGRDDTFKMQAGEPFSHGMW
ncbi:hypothetical protein TWF696_009751 [Orbilia brochopaga]|uniref:CENP-V/GFA domain-containing protein n=1 Tax=Orbilia brochopaga TaxID=3140254 RepID=A0AAV9UEJ9_9PEZI